MRKVLTKDVSLAMLAHDLRTPLSAMRLTAELIGTEPLTAMQSERLRILLQSIDALSDMTGELLHAEHRHDAANDLVELLHSVTDLYSVAAGMKGIVLESDLQDAAVTISTKVAAALRRAITALLDNAVKYTDEGTVSLSLRVLPSDGNTKQIIIQVSDTGPGIASGEQEDVFKPYFRGNVGLARSAGSGLGLSGARQLVRALGGELRQIAHEGKGCCFEIRCPFSMPADQPETDFRPGLQQTGGTATHVLIVDDNDTNRRLLAAMLEAFSMTCDQSSNGPDTIRMAAAHDYDAILLDLHMPGMDGFETARRVRALESCVKTPLIAISAALEAAGEKNLRQAGFDLFLSKPLSADALFEAMDLAREHRQKPGT